MRPVTAYVLALALPLAGPALAADGPAERPYQPCGGDENDPDHNRGVHLHLLRYVTSRPIW